MKVIEEGYLIHKKDTDEYRFPNFGIFTRKHNAEYQCELSNNRYTNKGQEPQYEVVPVQIVEVETNESTGRSMQSTQ